MSTFTQYPNYPYATGSGQYAQTAPTGYPTPQAYAPVPQTSWTQGWLAFNDPGYIKGLLLGAARHLPADQPQGAARCSQGRQWPLWSSVQGSVEEVKEQIEDIKAEMSMKADANTK